MSIKTAAQLAAKCKEIAQEVKTLYVLGCIGAPLNAANKQRYINSQSFNRKLTRKGKIQKATADTFGFDCVCLIKSILWDWDGDTGRVYGGATYCANGVPDVDANAMFAKCKEKSADFSKIEVGEVVWMDGHIGVYIGDGLAVECTPNWKDGVQITAVHNISTKAGYNGRKWTKHGKLPYIKYTAKPEVKKEGFTVEMRTLKRGSTGEDVRALQILLKGRGYNGKMGSPDGIFGAKTEAAVKLYQKAKGLTQDGIAGPKTLASLLGA